MKTPPLYKINDLRNPPLCRVKIYVILYGKGRFKGGFLKRPGVISKTKQGNYYCVITVLSNIPKCTHR